MTDTAHPEVEAPELVKTTLDINEICRILPHRFPFLLIDRVIDLKRKERIVAIKNVTINEPFFDGHFPNLPIMPGVLIVEAIAQAGGALLLTEVEDRDQKLMVFTGIANAITKSAYRSGLASARSHRRTARLWSNCTKLWKWMPIFRQPIRPLA